MIILGISAFYHDSAACLVKNGHIVAAVQEERFSRIKNDDSFPKEAIQHCLKAGNVDLQSVDFIVYYEKPFLKFERILETHVREIPIGFVSFLRSMPVWVKGKLFQKRTLLRELSILNFNRKILPQKLLFAGHHQSHAGSAFYASPFEKALVFVLDGVGEWATSSVWIGEGNKLSQISEIRFPDSLGLLYSSFTYYLGFKINSDEYKVMGLAPYGKPIYADLILNEIVSVNSDGSFRLNMRYFNYTTGLSMINRRFCDLFGTHARKAGDEITTFHMDIAASIQKVTEQIILKMTAFFTEKYDIHDLCFAGGVALNCVVNGKILQQPHVSRIWVQPAAGDCGGALGAALTAYYHHLNEPRRTDGIKDIMQGAFLGPEYSSSFVEVILKDRQINYQRYNEDEFLDQVCESLELGKAIGWFMGRMEFGPRALGARSIIADCRPMTMQSRLNLKVKFRESFRPFAPAILLDHVFNYYDLKHSSPYMQIVANLKSEHRLLPIAPLTGFAKLNQPLSMYPAVTHVDYTSRIQTVDNDNGTFYKLLNKFYDRTGCPMIINTSFNVRDQPIVCSPEDAINCFLNTDLDILAIENIIVRKK